MRKIGMHILANQFGVLVGVLEIDRAQLAPLGHPDGGRHHMDMDGRLIVAIGIMQERSSN
nr:hypothetical protein [Hyphomonas sp.]